MKQERGFTLIELLIVVAILGIVAVIAVPGLLRARLSANEVSAIGSLRAINSGQTTYAASCAMDHFASTLVDLVTPPTGTNTGFVSPDLSGNGIVKSGYVVNLGVGALATPTKTACNGATTVPTYFAEAHPASSGSSGQRSFGTDQRRTIFQDPSGATFTQATVATATSPIQ